jgi:hypothetical protein
MIMATPENEALVSRLYTEALETEGEGRKLSIPMRVVHDVEHLSQEVNSGASFEQYFRWASVEELGRIDGHLAQLGLQRARDLTAKAMKVAFPGGLPKTPEAQEDATEWTEEQEEKLSGLFEAFENENGHITNVLAEFARRAGL